MKKYGIALIEKPLDKGICRSEVMDLFDRLEKPEAFPLEIEEEASVAMGFITPDAAESLNYDYKGSGLKYFIGNILADMESEPESREYEFAGIKIWLER